MINSFFTKKGYITGLMVIIVLGGTVATTFIIQSLYQAFEYYLINQSLGNIVNHANKCTSSSNAFLLNCYTDEGFYKNGQNSNTIAFERDISQAKEELINLSKNKAKDKLGFGISLIEAQVDSLETVFREMELFYKTKGLKNSGLERDMRESIKKVEQASFLPDVKPILSLQNHEKNFLLQKDPVYSEKLNEESKNLRNTYLNNNSLNENQKTYLIEALNEYRQTFNIIVEIEKIIGLNEGEGFRKKIIDHQSKIENALVETQKNITKLTERSFDKLEIVVWVISGLMFAFFIVLTLLFNIFNATVKKPVFELKRAAEAVSNGSLSVDISGLKKFGLLRELTISIEEIIDKFRETINTVDRISKREDLHLKEITHENDEIGLAIKNISEQFIIMQESEQQRSWHNQGLARFADITREENEVKSLCAKVVKEVVAYLNLNQAAMFVVNEKNGEPEIELKATYAYNRVKHLERTINLGEGLIGQCLLEKDNIYLTDIPKDYVKITSGLGEATPKTVFILVCKTKGNVEAIIEMASFSKLEKYQIEFLEKLSDIIASTIYFIRINEQTSVLMHDFKQQAESLKLQEEEMRQNLEELSATQEELMRREQEYKNQISKLESAQVSA